jgi:hypothetical protein
MTVHQLNGCFERVRRADEHIADLRQRIVHALGQQENEVVAQFDPYPPYNLKLMGAKNTFITMRIGVLIGEICYNLRSALDYLVFELAKFDSGVEQSGTQFPIMDAKQNFDGRGKEIYLKGVNRVAHAAAIERLQPYNGCQWTRSLREASNPDKHRHFVEAGGSFVATVHSSLETDLSRIVGHARTELHPIIGSVEMKVHMTGSVAFSDGTPIVETLEEVKLKIADTLNAFKPDF